MPATEQTWRDQKTLHMVFGASALVMLITTIWMMAKDHTREWKGYQTTQADIEAWTLRGRINEQQTADYQTRLKQAEAGLSAARAAMIDRAAIARFQEEVQRDAEQRGARPYDFSRMETRLADLEPLAAAAAAAQEAAAQAQAEAERARGLAAQAEQEASPEAAALRAAANEAGIAAGQAVQARRRAEEDAAKVRKRVVAELDDVVRRAKFREDNLSREKKFKAADETAVLSLLGIAVGENQTQEAARLQAQVDEIRTNPKDGLEVLTTKLDAALEHRKALERILKAPPDAVTPEGIVYSEDEAQKKLADTQADIDRLHDNLKQTASNFGKRLLRMPVIDAFDNSDLRIDQIWLPDLTINYNFSDIARFDRCITCHRSIDTTAPGSAIEPAYLHELAPFAVRLPTPAREPLPVYDEQGRRLPVEQEREEQLRAAYGLRIAERGLISRDDTVIEVVWPETPAANAGLQMGDVITEINDARLSNRTQAVASLLSAPLWGRPLKLTVRRGLPHPYATHPRLDLFVGSLSPHPSGEMGCTICHDGQGSGTEFKWASHTPDDPEQAEAWRRKHGWFDNHHWIFPMYPKRFAESTCLKCHHDVTELEPSERFPEPPAPKLMAGHHLIQRYGCFGCHEVSGFDGPNKRVGPDLRSEPNFEAIAYAVLEDENLSEQEQRWARTLVEHPEDAPSRRRLRENILADVEKANGGDSARLSAATHKLADLLKDLEVPGKLRKVGPSLRFLESKVDFDFLYSWVHKPSDFRPSTTMPQFFELWEHLEPGSAGLAEAEKYEPVEIRAITEYLLNSSKPFEYLQQPSEVTEEASAERGKLAFEVRGCLACHTHTEFPEIKSDQGPDLSRLGGKFKGEKGAQWLYTWLKQPSKYHARTKMPDLFLHPVRNEEGTVTDPAADITAWLLSDDRWSPEGSPSRRLSEQDRQDLFDLALLHLVKQHPRHRAVEYLTSGIPASMADQVKGDDAALIGKTDDPDEMLAKQLEYVGRRTISKYGCAGCHDVPGFEDAKPIGTGLADWGRKDSSQLAFELVGQFLDPHHGHGGGHGHADSHADHAHDDAHGHVFGPELSEAERKDPATQYFLGAIQHHNRQGFLWQKLRQPRSYDYQKTENKDYNDRLRMPRFPLNAEEREQIMTFVLGLVSEPPATKYIYKPDPRREAIVRGREVLEKYNCGGCHALEMERWEFDYHEHEFDSPPPMVDFPFLEDHFTPEQIAESLQTDRRGLRRAVVYGQPALDEQTGRPLMYDEEQDPIAPGEEGRAKEIFHSFGLWKPALINGEARIVGSPNLLVRSSGTKKFPAWGGDLANYLYPKVIELELAVNPQAKGSEAWGWLPPPLVGQGAKVQTDWMHDFLLDPHQIRPSVVLRMPKFNMSSEEATKIANYFAAIDNVRYPYEYDERKRESRLLSLSQQRPDHLNDALKIIVDNNYCIKCHQVGDFVPQGRPAALAPDLAEVHRRLRPAYLRNWLANPKRLLPYTGMPVNIPYNPTAPHLGGVSQELYPGTSVEQLDAVVDFLLNYNRYVQQQVSIKPLVKPPAPGQEAAQEAAEAAPPAAREPVAGGQ